MLNVEEIYIIVYYIENKKKNIYYSLSIENKNN